VVVVELSAPAVVVVEDAGAAVVVVAVSSSPPHAAANDPMRTSKTTSALQIKTRLDRDVGIAESTSHFLSIGSNYGS